MQKNFVEFTTSGSPKAVEKKLKHYINKAENQEKIKKNCNKQLIFIWIAFSSVQLSHPQHKTLSKKHESL